MKLDIINIFVKLKIKKMPKGRNKPKSIKGLVLELIEDFNEDDLKEIKEKIIELENEGN
ncbi:hypothetical protein KAR91_38760 [Candidatus Pacearchaeota archaeon]|nr:hypothetical protein [Candidatus Pacearchaeota archaeon]